MLSLYKVNQNKKETSLRKAGLRLAAVKNKRGRRGDLGTSAGGGKHQESRARGSHAGYGALTAAEERQYHLADGGRRPLAASLLLRVEAPRSGDVSTLTQISIWTKDAIYRYIWQAPLEI